MYVVAYEYEYVGWIGENLIKLLFWIWTLLITCSGLVNYAP